jgi:short-subunit dehydrogenase
MNTTLITGASSGIGAAFARKLAKRGRNVLLVARSEEKLIALCNEIGRVSGIRAQHVVMDLTEPDAAARLLEETRKRELLIDMLINNAGFGSMGDFTRLELETELEMIDLNVRSLVDLTYKFLLPMRERRQGTIINVASTAAFQAVPFMATYAATKAFVLSFSEALAEENAKHGIRVLALCPGVTDTNFFAASKIDRPPMRTVQTATRRCVVSRAESRR